MSSDQTVAEASGSGDSTRITIEGFRPGPKGVPSRIWCYTARDPTGSPLFTALGNNGLRDALQGYSKDPKGLGVPSDDKMRYTANRVRYKSHPDSGGEQITLYGELRGTDWIIEPRMQDTPIPKGAPIFDCDSFRLEATPVGEASSRAAKKKKTSVGEASWRTARGVASDVDRSKWSLQSRGEEPGQEACINVSRVEKPTRDKKYLATDPWSETGHYASSSFKQLRTSLGIITASTGPSEEVLSRLSALEPGTVAKATMSSNGRWQIQ